MKIKPKKKLYFVKREVYAESLEAALHASGIVYAVELAGEQYQKEQEEPVPPGFTP